MKAHIFKKVLTNRSARSKATLTKVVLATRADTLSWA